MKNILLVLVLVGFGIGSMGCAHVHQVEGSVAKSEIPEGVMVGIGGQEVSEGDKVSVMQSVCKMVNGPRVGKFKKCRYVRTGEALVLKVLDHDSAIVRPAEGMVMDNSMRVEKQ